MLPRSEGFSLVELTIAVAIMSILSAIAIPAYLKFQVKARESELRMNLSAIRACEEVYKAENDVYLACAPNPGAIPEGAVAWPAGLPGWDDLRFEPDGDVRYQYEIVIGANSSGAGTNSTTYDAIARGDVDGDGETVKWTVTQINNTPSSEPAGEH